MVFNDFGAWLALSVAIALADADVLIAFATHDGDIAGHRKTPGAIDYCPIIPLALHCGYLK